MKTLSLLLALLLLMPSAANADQIDDGVRAEYRMMYGVSKGRFGYDCRKRKSMECYTEFHKNDTALDYWIPGRVKEDNCPNVHSQEMYDACKEEVDKEFPDLPKESK